MPSSFGSNKLLNILPGLHCCHRVNKIHCSVLFSRNNPPSLESIWIKYTIAKFFKNEDSFVSSSSLAFWKVLEYFIILLIIFGTREIVF